MEIFGGTVWSLGQVPSPSDRFITAFMTFAAFFIFYYGTLMLHATMLQFKYFLSIHLISLQFQEIKTLHRWPQATCTTVCFQFCYTLCYCISLQNYTFTARGVMSRRKYSRRKSVTRKVPQLSWYTTHFIFVMCTVISFDGRLKTVLKYLSTALLIGLSQK